MRGNPILQVGVLLAAICLAGILVATVLGKADQGDTGTPETSGESSPSAVVPALLTLTLSAPARSITFTEPSGRTITIPTGPELEIEEDVELTIRNESWTADLTVKWQDPAVHHFIRLDLEPDNLKTTRLLLDFPGNTSDHPIEAGFTPAR